MSDPKPSRILILSSAEDEESTAINNAFISSLNQHLEGEAVLEWCNYHNIRLEFRTGKIVAELLATNEALEGFSFVYFKSYFRYHEQAAAIAEYLQEKDIPFVSSELKDYIAGTKLTQFARLARAGLPIVDTIYMHAAKYEQHYDELAESFGGPFIFKSIDGSGGQENYLIKNRQQMIDALAEYPDLQFVAQQFVPNDSDYRVLIVGGEIRLIIQRTRRGSSHLNNTSQGGSAKLIDLDRLEPEYREMCLKAAKIMHRETAGVDLMFENKSEDPYILEVNASPQIGSGAYVDKKIEIYSEYFKNVLKYTNSSSN